MGGNFAGYVQLGNAIDVVVIANSSNVPTDTDSLPTYRIYGPAGFTSISGNLTLKDTGTITNAPPASPTVYTSVGHNLSVGTSVTITGIGGNTGANVTQGIISAVTTNTFTIVVDTHAGSAYTSGGSWHAVGVYDWNYTPTIGNNFASGLLYTVYVYGRFSGTTQVIDFFHFIVT